MIGEIAANFRLYDQQGILFDLYENLTKKVLLVFYPRDNSLVCTMQFKNYQSNLDLFDKNNILPVGINVENSNSHKNFCDNLGLKFKLLTDADKAVSKRFGALNFLGMNKRKLVLINTDRKIIFEKTTLAINFIATDDIIKELKSSNII